LGLAAGQVTGEQQKCEYHLSHRRCCVGFVQM
jgi:hypothetical protein